MVVGVLPRPPCLFFFKIGDPCRVLEWDGRIWKRGPGVCVRCSAGKPSPIQRKGLNLPCGSQRILSALANPN